MKEAASLGGLTSRFATDIVNCTIEPFDKIVDPLVLRLIDSTVGLLTVPVARYRCRRPRRQRAFFRDGHQATSPRLSASLSISCWHTRHVNVCRSKASPRTGCGVRRVKRIRFLHFGQTGLSVAPKRVGMANSFGLGGDQPAIPTSVPMELQPFRESVRCARRANSNLDPVNRQIRAWEGETARTHPECPSELGHWP